MRTVYQYKSSFPMYAEEVISSLMIPIANIGDDDADSHSSH